uniref:SecY-independent transporter protein n=1 Tax=Kappaphycus malesianus TaxID=1408293 RepID=UPI002237A5AB|nr:SecY-independent transporter protein [Kappaphycus malesianus]UYR20492.1 SecY-independent transporter protein [Kappaphycus malesianus]
MFQIYAVEFCYRFFYILLSFFGCLILALIKIDVILLFEIYPFLEFSTEKLLATRVTDLIDVVWILSFYNSLLFVYPLFVHHLIVFLKMGFYNYQTYVLLRVIKLSTLIYMIVFAFLHLYFLPNFFSFLLSWKISSFENLLNVKTELRITYYIDWILSTECFISSVVYWLSIIISKVLLTMNVDGIYEKAKRCKKQTLFLMVLSLFLLFPSDFYLQFGLLLISFFLVELIFLSLCYMIKNF